MPPYQERLPVDNSKVNGIIGTPYPHVKERLDSVLSASVHDGQAKLPAFLASVGIEIRSATMLTWEPGFFGGGGIGIPSAMIVACEPGFFGGGGMGIPSAMTVIWEPGFFGGGGMGMPSAMGPLFFHTGDAKR